VSLQSPRLIPTQCLRIADIPVILPENDELNLDNYLGHGLQPGEEELPHTSNASGPSQPQVQVDAETLSMLESMGFPTENCRKALIATGNIGAEAAMEWLINHIDDPGAPY
jgi:ubiquitin carboxyl-terminal hydrolase 5/13